MFSLSLQCHAGREGEKTVSSKCDRCTSGAHTLNLNSFTFCDGDNIYQPSYDIKSSLTAIPQVLGAISPKRGFDFAPWHANEMMRNIEKHFAAAVAYLDVGTAARK